MKLVITGCAGSGKSSLANKLAAHLGYELHSVDTLVKAIWDSPAEYLTDIELGRFYELCGGLGFLDIRELIFTQAKLRASFERLFKRTITAELEKITAYDNVILEFPLLFEKFNFKIYESFDQVICVTIDHDTQHERLEKRGWSEKVIASVRKAQFTDIERANFVKNLCRTGAAAGIPCKLISGSSNNDEIMLFANSLKPKLGSKRAVLAGSYDPVTLGHKHVFIEAAKLMDSVVVALAVNPNKKYFYSKSERAAMLMLTIAEMPKELRAKVRVEEVPTGEVVATWAEAQGAKFMLRGIRSTTDFEYEHQLFLVNHKVAPDVTTLYVIAPRSLTEVSSSLIRNSLSLTDWRSIVSGYVAPSVFNLIAQKQHENGY